MKKREVFLAYFPDRTPITRFECQLLGVNDEVLADSAGGGEMVPDRG